MMRWQAKVAVLLVLVAVGLGVLAACSADDGTIPPCTPVEGSERDPCEPDLTQSSDANVRSINLLGDEPWPIREYLDSGDGLLRTGHIVVRGQYIPGTVRCETRNIDRAQPYTTLKDYELESGLGFVICYADVNVAAYIVGQGPSTLTVLAETVTYWDPRITEEEAEEARRSVESVFIQGGNAGNSRIRGVPSGGITGVESILFLGPAIDASIEAWEVFFIWDVERRDDGTVIAVHPDRDAWARRDNYETAYRSKAEWTLTDFTTEAQAARRAMVADYDGRIDEAEDLPQLVTNANNLHAFHVETGNVNHPDGPPETSLPPPCGLAVPDQTSNPGLMLDCMALLEGKDTLRGTGTLNWGVDEAISGWDGITTGGTPSRVTKLELADKSLTGSIPAALARLNLATLKLAGNSLTGCIPPALRDVPTNDLDALGLPDCAE